MRELKARGADVFIIMTERATHFVGQLTFETLSNNPVAVDMFDANRQWYMEHIALADRADLLIVAPATVDCIGKAACGIADDLVSTTIVTMLSSVPILMAPAMNTRMWENSIVQRNVDTLRDAGVAFVGPVEGKLAEDRIGMGRMAEVDSIVSAAEKILS